MMRIRALVAIAAATFFTVTCSGSSHDSLLPDLTLDVGSGEDVGGPDVTSDTGGGIDVPPVPYGGWPALTYAGAQFGASVQERPFIVERFGETGPTVYLMNAIHGNERGAQQVGERMRTHLILHPELVEDVQIAYVTIANPDGYVANTRYNYSGVDLNRNFPATNYDDHDDDPKYGPYAASEPETQSMVAIVEDLSPSAIVTTHTTSYSEPNAVNYDGPAETYANAASAASGFRIDQDFGIYPGSFGSWAGVDLQIPTLTLELETDIPSIAGHDPGVAAVEAVVLLAATETPSGASVLDLLPEPAADEIYEGWKMGESAGTRPLLAERFGGDGAPILVVGGLDGRRMSTFAAERLRAQLLTRFLTPLAPREVLLVTVANPDGLVAGRGANNDGDVPAASFPTGGGAASSPEATALMDLITTHAPVAVIVLQDGDRTSGIGGDGDARALVLALARETGLTADNELAPQAGSLAAWCSSQGIPAAQVALTSFNAAGNRRIADATAIGLLAAMDSLP